MNLTCAFRTAMVSQIRVLGIATLAAAVYATAVHDARSTGQAATSALFLTHLDSTMSLMPCELRTALVK